MATIGRRADASSERSRGRRTPKLARRPSSAMSRGARPGKDLPPEVNSRSKVSDLSLALVDFKAPQWSDPERGARRPPAQRIGRKLLRSLIKASETGRQGVRQSGHRAKLEARQGTISAEADHENAARRREITRPEPQIRNPKIEIRNKFKFRRRNKLGCQGFVLGITPFSGITMADKTLAKLLKLIATQRLEGEPGAMPRAKARRRGRRRRANAMWPRTAFWTLFKNPDQIGASARLKRWPTARGGSMTGSRRREARRAELEAGGAFRPARWRARLELNGQRS